MEIYRKIDRENFQFDFVVFEGELRDNYHEIVELGGNVYECPRYNVNNHWKFVSWWKQFFRDHTEYRIFHSHLRSCVSIILPIARKAGCTTIVHSHSTSNGSGIKAMAKAILQWPIRFQADYLFACSEESGRWLFGKKAIYGENYQTIPNCIDTTRFAFSQEKRLQLREELNIAPDEYVIGHVGRFHEAKNHRFLVDVFAEVLKKQERTRLMLVGDGELREEIRTYCSQLGVLDKVIFVGSKSDTAPYYSAMDVFVFPSLWEGVPVSVVEAQIAGAPCIISDRITKDVDLLDEVKYLPLDQGSLQWIDSVISVGNKSGFIKDYIQTNGGAVDYIHGEANLKKLVDDNGSAVGILFEKLDKGDLFKYVSQNGAFPRKTFSMGEGVEKRYYLEGRRITND